jgi:hypothetical protein
MIWTIPIEIGKGILKGAGQRIFNQLFGEDGFKATEYALLRPRLVDHQAVIAQRRSGTSVGAAAHRRCVVARKWTQALMLATSAHCAISSGYPSMRPFQRRRALSKCIAAPDQRSVQRLPEFWR